MNRFTQLAAAVACSLPLLVVAQTSPAPSAKVVPADQPRSNLEKEQTQQNGDATKYGQPGSAGSTQPTATDSTPKAKMKKAPSKKNDDTSTATPTNTVSPTKTD